MLAISGGTPATKGSCLGGSFFVSPFLSGCPWGPSSSEDPPGTLRMSAGIYSASRSPTSAPAIWRSKDNAKVIIEVAIHFDHVLSAKPDKANITEQLRFCKKSPLFVGAALVADQTPAETGPVALEHRVGGLRVVVPHQEEGVPKRR